MKYCIGKFAPATGTVPVTFEHDGVIHKIAVGAIAGPPAL